MTVHKLKKFILLLVFISGAGNACRAEGNLPFVDQKLIHFGFLLGLNTMDFKVTPNDNARVSKLEPGITFGIITDLRLNRYFNLRFTPSLYFGERDLNFKISPNSDSINIKSIPICFPFYLKYSAERKGNYRPYIIGGGGISYDFSTKEDIENPVTLTRFNFYSEFGIGCDIYFSFFKLAPELKYSIGFNNILVPNRPDLNSSKQRFTNALNSLKSRMITLSFNFE